MQGRSAMARTVFALGFLLVVLLRGTALQSESKKSTPRIIEERFGQLADGREVLIYTVENSRRIRMRVMNYGAIIVSLETLDRRGQSADIVLGFDNLQGYQGNKPYFGAVIGRYANRIAHGEFTLDGIKYKLAQNNGTNSLHGGTQGFDKVLWHSEPFEDPHARGITFTYTSKDGEEEYPGSLKTRVTYTLNDEDELIIEYEATTDKATPVNLTQHAYFNLTGEGSKDVLQHVVKINADRFTPVDRDLIPTGELRSLERTPLDFTKTVAIGEHIDEKYEQLQFAGGYDHNFVLIKNGTEPSFAARVTEPTSGRVVEVYTDQPGMQLYSGNFLDGTIIGKHGHAYGRRSAFCLETQHFADSPNHPNFPSTILRPGGTFHSKTIYKFSADADSKHD
jgi:aldose 1-epimerase